VPLQLHLVQLLLNLTPLSNLLLFLLRPRLVWLLSLADLLATLPSELARKPPENSELARELRRLALLDAVLSTQTRLKQFNLSFTFVLRSEMIF